MIKKKNIYVISVSVSIILLVILSSFLGLIIYLQWRHLSFIYSHYETLEKLDTISYAKNIEISSPKIMLGFNELGVVEGRLKNKGVRSIASLTLKVNLLDTTGVPIYSCIIYPLAPLQPPRFFKKIYFAHPAFLRGFSLKPNETIVFKCVLWRCPRKFIKMLKKGSFSNKQGEWCGNILVEVAQVRLI